MGRTESYHHLTDPFWRAQDHISSHPGDAGPLSQRYHPLQWLLVMDEVFQVASRLRRLTLG